MALNYQQPRDPGESTRNRWAQSLDGIMEAYMASKKNAQFQGRLDKQDAIAADQRVNAEKDRQGAALLQNGFDPRQVTPEVMQRADMGAPQGPASPGMPSPEQAENPLFGAVRAFMEKKKSAASMAAKGAQLDQTKTQAEIDALNRKDVDRDQIYVDPTNGKRIVIPKGAKLLPPTAKQEGRILPANSVLALNEGKAVARILPEVEQAIKDNESIFGPVEGRTRSANPYDEKSQTVDARMRTASQAFGRFMEGGVLRKEDEDKYRKMFPQLSDVPQVAKNKLSIVRRQLAQKYQDDKGALGGSGYDIAGFGDLEIPPSLFGEGAAVGKGGLSKAEQDELAALEKRFGGGK